MKLNYSKLFDIARDQYARMSYNSNSGKAMIPLRWTLELTYQCNLRCPYCYVGACRQKNELNTEDWFKIIDKIPFWAIVTLVGGEPLLRKDFIPILEKTCKRTMGKVNVVSNGILINDEVINAFIRTKLLLLSISLDGYGKNHDKNRAKEGIFDKIISNLDNLNSKKRNNKPLIDIKTIILENNLDDMPKLYKLCEKMDFDFLSIAFLRNNDLKQNSVLRDTFGEEFYAQNYPIEPYFDMEHFSEVFNELKSLEKTGKTKIRWAPKFDGGDELTKIKQFFGTQKDVEVQKIYQPCLYPWSNVLITPEADVYPCLSYKIGNIKEKLFNEVWNAPQFKCFRKNLKARGVFNACQMCCELTPKVKK